MTPEQKLDIMSSKASLDLEHTQFEKLTKISGEEKMIPSGSWVAYVTFFVESPVGIMEREDTFHANSFSLLVDRIWSSYTRIFE